MNDLTEYYFLYNVMYKITVSNLLYNVLNKMT